MATYNKQNDRWIVHDVKTNRARHHSTRFDACFLEPDLKKIKNLIANSQVLTVDFSKIVFQDENDTFHFNIYYESIEKFVSREDNEFHSENFN
jgi:hypothetical protein